MKGKNSGINIPNALTVLRLLLIGVFVHVFFNQQISYNMHLAFGIFILAGITDLLDGYIARRFDLVTKWGKLMDPLADKLMLLTVLTCLTITGIIPGFVIIIVALKELLMILGAVFLYQNRRTVVQSNFYGKAATVSFYLAVTLLMFNIPYARLVLTAAVLAALLAFVQYTRQHFENKSQARD